MNDNKVFELFANISNSKEYLEYQKIGDIIKKDKKINTLINEIKSLQKESTYLESINDMRYKELDKITEQKVSELNQNKTYQKYLENMQKFNDIILNSTSKKTED